VVLVSLLLAAPSVAFWLWFVILRAKVALLCPEKCTCYTGGYFISCTSDLLTDLPFIHLTGLRLLVLHSYNLTLLEKDSFVSLTDLMFLDINFSELKTIELGAFNWLTKLTHLILMMNNLNEIFPGTFENLSSLEILALDFNEINHLNIAVFSGLTKLTELTIRGNQISELLTGTFESLNSLEFLDLSKNRIEYLNSDVFFGLVNLVILSMAENQLQYLHPHVFLRLPNIKSLNLGKNRGLKFPTDRNFINSISLSGLGIAGCNISSLSVETFTNVSALSSLHLSENNLKTVDIDILRALPELSELYLYGNPLQCDCQLQELRRWCKDRDLRTLYGREVPECDTPREVKGVGWGVVEKGQCLKGNMEYFGDYNSTSYSQTDIEEHEKKYSFRHPFDEEFINQHQLPVYTITFIFGTIANVIVLIIIICNKDMRTVSNMYILNLAISDIIYLTVLFSEACANRINRRWDNDEIICTFVSFCHRISVGLSAYSVALYSFQRYRVTARPFQFQVGFSSQIKWRGILIEICGVWIVAALVAVPSTISKYLCQEFWVTGLITYYQHVVIFELLVTCVLPLCVIAFSYIMTARHLVESSRAISEGTQNSQLNLRRNSAKIVVGLTVVFVISYLPYHVFWSYFMCSEYKFPPFYKTYDLHPSNRYEYVWLTYIISTCFLSVNSCLNPVALFCTSYHFRHHLKRYLTCFCKTSSASHDLELG